MREIDRARVIRDLVLRSTDDVVWGSTVFDRAEHPCWHVRGDGWRATLSNLWDVMTAPGRDRPAGTNDCFELSQQSILEVYEVDEDRRILGMSSGVEPSDDLLFHFDAESCRRIFRVELAVAQIERERRYHPSTVTYGTAFAA